MLTAQQQLLCKHSKNSIWVRSNSFWQMDLTRILLIWKKVQLFPSGRWLFKWWEEVCEAYEAGSLLTAEEKQQRLDVHLQILEALIRPKSICISGMLKSLWPALGCGQCSLCTCSAAPIRRKSQSKQQG